MRLPEFIDGCLEQHYNAMARSVEGLTDEEMRWRPDQNCSSIGFLVWHYGRTMDRWIHSRLQGAPQLWELGWDQRLGHSDVPPDDTGYGYGPEQLASFRTPPTTALMDYATASLEAARRFLATVPVDDFAVMEVINPRGGTMTLANMCQQLLWEFNQHGGQIAYIRGMLKGLEDSRYSGGLLEGLAARRASGQ